MFTISHMPKQLKPDQIKAIILARFNCLEPSKNSWTYMTYPQISRLTGLRVNVIEYACRKAKFAIAIGKQQDRM